MKRACRFSPILAGLFIFLPFLAVAQPVHPVYSVTRVAPDSIRIDGKIAEEAWGQADLISKEMQSPWERETAPRTEFRALWDEEFFYFSFLAHDDDLIVVDHITEEHEIGDEDRVELFFSPGSFDRPLKTFQGDCQLPVYYGVEIDALARVMDFSAVYYRKIDLGWETPGLRTKASRGHGYYVVEGKIPLTTLEEMGVLNDNQPFMHVGVFRAEFTRNTGGVTRSWITWRDPETPQPDFHVSEAMGLFRFAGYFSD